MTLKRIAIVISLFLLLAGCSNTDKAEESKSSYDSAEDSALENNDADTKISLSKGESDSAGEDGEKKAIAKSAVERMVIFNAELNLLVKDYAAARDALEAKAKSYNGYIVQSSSNRNEGEQQNGTMTFRIPQEHFQNFLNDAEGISVEVNSRDVSGQDVTEEYVDLESRLKSKKTVEARLLEFMDQAEKTEDLLKISSDLADVQEEIEQISGRKKYLENQTAFSTVTIWLAENAVNVPKIDNENLNTWQKIKKQFADNINLILSFGSAFIVFLIGNLPILLILGITVGAVVYFIKKFSKSQGNDIDTDS